MIQGLRLRSAVPSPVPGMDPYTENPEGFPDFHDCFIIDLRATLQARLLNTPARPMMVLRHESR